MSQAPTDGMSLLDPFGFWKTARDANLEAWSKLMIDLVNSDEYSQATGLALEQTLATSQPFRDAIERVMTHTLAMLNMPTRAEVTTIAERLVNVEMRLDDMDAKINTVQVALQESMKETVRQAMTTPNRHLKDIAAQLEAVEAAITKVSTFQESMKDSIREALATPSRHIREIEARLEDVDTKYSNIQDTVKEAVRAAMATPSRHMREIEARLEDADTKLEAVQDVLTPSEPEPKAQPKPQPKAKPAAKKEQEAK